MIMPSQQHNNYLESRVLTASSHSLHLMLIEGAIRFGRQAEAALQRGDLDAADGPLMRTLDIVGEMLVGVRAMKADLNRQIASFYLYLFRIIGEAKVNNDTTKLTEALGLLEFERQTWLLVCEKIGNAPMPTVKSAQAKPPISKSNSAIAPALGGALPAKRGWRIRSRGWSKSSARRSSPSARSRGAQARQRSLRPRGHPPSGRPLAFPDPGAAPPPRSRPD